MKYLLWYVLQIPFNKENPFISKKKKKKEKEKRKPIVEESQKFING